MMHMTAGFRRLRLSLRLPQLPLLPLLNWRLWLHWPHVLLGLRRLHLGVVLVAFGPLAHAVDAPPTQFGIRFVVDVALAETATARQAAEERLTRYVTELNSIFKASGVALVARVAEIEFSAFSSDDMLEILADMDAEHGSFMGLQAAAAATGGDYSFAVHSKPILRGKRGCGRGIAVNQTVAELRDPQRRYAVIDIACGTHTFAHELGHLMGLNHGYLVDQCQPKRGHTSAIAPYANGYAVGPCDGRPDPAKFGTLMVGGWMREIQGDQKSVPLFSNPRVKDRRCGTSQVCGDPETADEARALNENARHYVLHPR